MSYTKKIAVYTFDNTISADCPIQLRSSESNSFKDFQTVDTVDGNITHRTIYVSNDVVITRMQIYYQSSLLTVEYMCIDENITSCGGLVANAKKLTYINTDNWDTKNAKDMSSMFVGCELLTDLNLSHLDTSQVESMRMMFWGCKSLQNLNVIGWNTSKVVDMYGMFGSCTMTTLDISSFDTSSVTEYNSMFSGFSSTQEVYVGKKWTLGTSGFGASIIVTNTFTYTLAKYTFDKSVADCLPNITGATSSQWSYSDRVDGNITTRTIGTDDANVKPTAYNFNDKKSLLSIDYIKIDSNVTSLYRLVRNCTRVTYVNTQGWDVSNVTTCDSMCSGASALPSIDLSNLNFTKPVNFQYMFQNCTDLTEVNTTNFKASPTIMSNMFFQCDDLKSIDLSGCSLENVTSTYQMFRSCAVLTSIKFSNDNSVPKLTNTSYMFYDCAFTSIDLSTFYNTTALKDMSYMFGSCDKLKTIDLSNWDTSAVTTFSSLFQNCSALESVNLSNWNTEKVTTMRNMFSGCSKLKAIDLSYFRTPSVTTLESMFYGCSELTSLDLSTFKTPSLTEMNSMFYNCKKLKVLDISNFVFTDSVTTYSNFNPTNLTDISLIYASADTINLIASKVFTKTNTLKNIYYIDANESELTPIENVNFIPYRDLILQLEEDVVLRSNGEIYDELDLLTGQLTQRIDENNEILDEEVVRKVTISGEIKFNDEGKIRINSNEITPSFEFQVNASNYYEIPSLKPNTQYTLFFKGTPTKVDLGGTVAENPTTKSLITSGEIDNTLWFDTSVDEVMLIERDLTNRSVEYFTGVKSSQKIQVQLRGNSPLFGEGGRR